MSALALIGIGVIGVRVIDGFGHSCKTSVKITEQPEGSGRDSDRDPFIIFFNFSLTQH